MSRIVALEVDTSVLAHEKRIVGMCLVIMSAAADSEKSQVSCDVKIVKAELLINAPDWDLFYELVTAGDRLNEK